MKSKEELNALKAEVESFNKKLAELSEKELEEVVGGIDWHKETSGNAQAWYGIDNEGIFTPGSRLAERWISKGGEE